MTGYCPQCGHQIRESGACTSCTNSNNEQNLIDMDTAQGLVAATPKGVAGRPVGAPVQARLDLPKASTSRRLLGSGIEYLIYTTTIGLASALGIFTGGILGFLWVPFMLVVVGIRDLNAGAFSLGKKIGHMRVLDLKTAQPASNYQALLRNSYYLTLIFLMIVPYLKFAFEGIFLTLIIIDTLIVISSPTGRRIGDYMAGTQVVPVARN